jgi:hypothetical protein
MQNGESSIDGRRTSASSLGLAPAQAGLPGLWLLFAVVLLVVIMGISAARASGALPDHRSYELVSSGESGEPYLPPTPVGQAVDASGFRSRHPFRAAANGEAVAYVGEPASTGGTGETGPGEGNQWQARRTATGWQPEDITPTAEPGAEYQDFSDQLDIAIYEGTQVPLTAGVEPGCVSLYARTADNVFSPLFTAGETPKNCGHPLFAGATADESGMLFQSEAALVPPAEEATEADIPAEDNFMHHPLTTEGGGCMFGCNLYYENGGSLRLVNTIGGEAVPSATFGGYAPGKDPVNLEGRLTNFSNAISSDGSRIFWTDTLEGPNMEHVFVLEDGTSTVPVSGAGPAEYWAASADGHFAYYTEGEGLFRFDSQTNSREQLVPGSDAVQGVIGTNQTGADGSYVYFVANGVLTGSPNAQGEKAAPGTCPETSGTCNLYVLHEGVHFIAQLSGRDNQLNAATEGDTLDAGDWQASLGGRLASITPDGTELVFESTRSLTGYESSSEGEVLPGVFVYSAGDGSLSCASCDPSGAAPSVHENSFWSKLPQSAEAETFIRRFASSNGARVFFDTYQPLVPADQNGAQDVYEWERPAQPGEPDNTCTPEEASPETGGCTFLLSGGTSESDSFFVDASAEGNDVFIEHVGSLGLLDTPSDHNELFDVRVDGGFPEAAAACVSSCAPASVSAPGVPSPVTTGDGGLGNFPPQPPSSPQPSPRPKVLTKQQQLVKALKACKKYKKKSKRGSCQRRARARYHGHSPKGTRKRAGNNGRASS